jgi:hypothetical protein
VSPAKWRGAFGYSIQIGRSIGLFCRGLLIQGIANQVGNKVVGGGVKTFLKGSTFDWPQHWAVLQGATNEVCH